jgi:hypothetical protein
MHSCSRFFVAFQLDVLNGSAKIIEFFWRDTKSGPVEGVIQCISNRV